MIIAGFQKVTMIDYPGTVASTVFLAGCNFRCPFCHNPELVNRRGMSNTDQEKKIEKEFFQHLEKRKGKIEGVCITGGEPTLWPELLDFIKKIKRRGFLVKLDTNGTRPDVVRQATRRKLVDYIAMDIKNHLGKYEKTTGTKMDKERIKLSVDLIRNSGIPYEFRTTVVPGLHTEQDFLKIAKWLKGSRFYALQEFQGQKTLDPGLPSRIKNKKLNLKKIQKKIDPFFDRVEVRNEL